MMMMMLMMNSEHLRNRPLFPFNVFYISLYNLHEFRLDFRLQFCFVCIQCFYIIVSFIYAEMNETIGVGTNRPGDYFRLCCFVLYVYN